MEDGRWTDGRQMDKWTDGRMEGWINGRTDGWKDGWTEGRIERKIYRWTGGRIEITLCVPQYIIPFGAAAQTGKVRVRPYSILDHNPCYSYFIYKLFAIIIAYDVIEVL